MRDEEYFAIKERAAAVLLKIPHVTAVGLGGRDRNGLPTGEIVIKVFVNRKKPPQDVPPGEMVPASFEGVPTDVVAMGPPVKRVDPVPGKIHPGNAPGESVRTDPLQGGMVIGNEVGNAGTLGCFLLDKEDGTAIYALTNRHVVEEKDGMLSQSRRILRAAGDGTFESRPVGYSAAGTNDNIIDAAVVRLEAGHDWLPFIKEIGFVRGTYEVTIADSVTQNYQVRQRGQRLGLTGGILFAVGVETAGLPPGKKFDIIIKPNKPAPPNEDKQAYFTTSGDSGSVIVNADNEVIALHWGSEDLRTKPDVLASLAYGTPIDFVLKHFKKVHDLDLDVDTPTGADPTEATEVRRVLPPAGASLLSVPEAIRKRDPRHQRPLSGGKQILAEPFGIGNSATLGCIVTRVGDPGTAYILTSYAGLSANGSRPPTTDTDVGQPDNDSSCSGCCSNTVGEFEKGGPDDGAPTAAIARLEGDQKWLAEIMQIGFLEGTAPVTAADVNSGTYQVRKRGAGTRLTGGVVTAVGGVAGTLPPDVRADGMIIRPNPNPLRAGQPICLSRFIDRGAMVVNSDNKVVGLLYDEVEVPPNGGVFHGVATPIQIVLNGLNRLGVIDVQVATATAPGQVRTTASRVATDHDTSSPPVVAARRTPRDPVPGFPMAPPMTDVPAPAEVLGRLEAELSRSFGGRLAIAMWSSHRGEIRHLIDHNRRVATVWHRSSGPALAQALIRAFHAPSATIPRMVNGLPVAVCLDRLAHVFGKHGTPSLGADVTQLRALLPPIGGLSFAEILAALDAATRKASLYGPPGAA